MISYINIAENEETLFLAIEKKEISFDLIEEINTILSNKFFGQKSNPKSG